MVRWQADLQAGQGAAELDVDEALDRSALMGTLDKLNDRFGRGMLTPTEN